MNNTYYVMTPGLLISSVVTAQENLSGDRTRDIWCIESLTDNKSDDKIFISENEWMKMNEWKWIDENERMKMNGWKRTKNGWIKSFSVVKGNRKFANYNLFKNVILSFFLRIIYLTNQDDRKNMTEIGEHDQKVDNDEH